MTQGHEDMGNSAKSDEVDALATQLSRLPSLQLF